MVHPAQVLTEVGHCPVKIGHRFDSGRFRHDSLLLTNIHQYSPKVSKTQPKDMHSLFTSLFTLLQAGEDLTLLWMASLVQIQPPNPSTQSWRRANTLKRGLILPIMAKAG